MDYIVETSFQGPGFVAVPNHVAQSGNLSPEALGVLVYFASLPRGYIARVSSVQEAFSIGKDKWQRIARELRAAGAMDVHEVRGPGGRIVGRRVVVRWPDERETTESRKTRPSDRKPEKPAAGKPGSPEPENPPNRAGKPGSLERRKKNTAPAARFSISSLTPFQRSRVLAGQSVVIDGVALRSGSAEIERLARALRAGHAEKEVA